jgi:photosystem II stability/assembly factor-like uncharacterized protein
MKPLLFSLLLLAAAHAQWTRVSVPTTAGLRGLSVISNKVVWASGTGGTVIRTIDGGSTWSLRSIPGGENLDFRGIRAFDQNTAILISSGPAEKGQAKIYRTSDGGKTWTQVYEKKTPGIFFDAIAFWDSKHGIVLSDPVAGHFILFRTDDAGLTWKQLPAAVTPPALPNEGAFAASNSCLTVQGRANVWFATGGAGVARVFRSTDRGRTWSVSETPMHPANTSSGIFSIAFAGGSDGIAVGGDYQHPDGSDLANVLLTRDGGRSWHAAPATDPAGVYLSSVALEKHGIIAAGIKGVWSHSGGMHPNLPNSGSTKRSAWRQQSTENLNAVIAAHGIVWAVGPKGMVLKKNQ